MALILRYFTEFGSSWGALPKSGWRCCRKKVNVRYLISWRVSCFDLCGDGHWNFFLLSYCIVFPKKHKEIVVNSPCFTVYVRNFPRTRLGPRLPGFRRVQIIRPNRAPQIFRGLVHSGKHFSRFSGHFSRITVHHYTHRRASSLLNSWNWNWKEVMARVPGPAVVSHRAPTFVNLAGFVQILEKFGKSRNLKVAIFQALKSLENNQRYGKVWKLEKSLKTMRLTWKI